VVLVVRPVANPPAMVRHEDGGMENVADDAVEVGVVGEAPVATETRSLLCLQASHGRKSEIDREQYQSCPRTKSAQNMVPCAAQ
jgi:hypothetical protein